MPPFGLRTGDDQSTHNTISQQPFDVTRLSLFEALGEGHAPRTSDLVNGRRRLESPLNVQFSCTIIALNKLCGPQRRLVVKPRPLVAGIVQLPADAP